MKPPSLGVDYSNEYLAELRKQGLSAAEANKKLYERDREMPDEIVISLMLYCYDLGTGKKLWEREMYKRRPAGGRHSKNSFASETPTTDGQRVYVYLTDYGLFAYDFAGKQSWTTPLKAHATTRDWARAPPCAVQGCLFVLNDHESRLRRAFETRTGRNLAPAPDRATARKTWSSLRVGKPRAHGSFHARSAFAISSGWTVRSWAHDRWGLSIQVPFLEHLLFITSAPRDDTAIVRSAPAVLATLAVDPRPVTNVVCSIGVQADDRPRRSSTEGVVVLNDKHFSRPERDRAPHLSIARRARSRDVHAPVPTPSCFCDEQKAPLCHAGGDHTTRARQFPRHFSLATPAIVGDRLLIGPSIALFVPNRSYSGRSSSVGYTSARAPCRACQPAPTPVTDVIAHRRRPSRQAVAFHA